MPDHLFFFEDVEYEAQVLRDVDRKTRRQAMIARTVTPDVALRADQVARRYPWMSGGLALPLAVTGAPDAVVDAAARKEAARQESKGGFRQAGAVLTGAVRTAFTALEGVSDELFGRPVRASAAAGRAATEGSGFSLPRFLSELPRQYAATPSVASIALDDLASGRGVDLGEGFFPGGDVRSRQVAAAEAAGGGVAPTIGREFAGLVRPPVVSFVPGRSDLTYMTRAGDRVAEPGSFGHTVISGTVDAAAAIVLDPAAKGLKAVGAVRAAKKTFEGVADIAPGVRVGRYATPTDDKVKFGLIYGPRRSVSAEKAIDDFLMRDEAGKLFVSKAAEETDFATIWRAIPGIDRKTALALADESDEAGIVEIFRGVLGTDIRKVPAFKPRAMSEDVRLLRDVPGSHVSVENVDEGLATLDDFLVNAKVDRATRHARLRELAEVADGDVVGVQDVVLRSLKDVDEALQARGIDSTHAEDLARVFDTYAEDMRKYFVDEMARNVEFPSVKKRVLVNGEEEILPTAHLLSEYMQRAVPLPDFREIRKHASSLSKIKQIPGYEPVSENLAMLGDFFNQTLWKPFVLMRGAWTVRVIGEEQIRMGAAGLDAPMTHPISYMAWMMGRQGASDVLGNPMEDAAEFVAAMSRGQSGIGKSIPGAVLTDDYTSVPQGHKKFVASWAGELSQLWADPVARMTAAGRHSIDDVKQWFWDGSGKQYRERLATAGGDEKNVLLVDRAAADGYIDSVWSRIKIKTGEDADLIDSIATRQLDGVNLNLSDYDRRAVRKALTKRVDRAPAKVKAPRDAQYRGRFGDAAKLFERWDKAVDAGFRTLMGTPTNKLSRSPAFKQFYWQEAERLLHYADDAAKARVLAAAGKAGLDPKAIKRMHSIQGSGSLDNLDDLDVMAKAHGLNSTKKLLYDLSKKNQIADSTRVIFPFGEAWKEIWTAWIRLGVENPQIARRAMQGIEGFRGAGFFAVDPVTEKETFHYPGGDLLAKLLGLGDKTGLQLSGNVGGLNIIGSTFLPGVGPLVQWPASRFLPDAPEWDTIRNLILPFGPQEGSTAGDFVNSNMPAYLKKVFQGFTKGEVDEPHWNNTVAALARHAILEGRFKPAEYKTALDWAAKRAGPLYIFNGIAQAFLPTGPKIDFMVEDKTGRWVQTQALAKEFYGIVRETGDYGEAVAQFVDKFGIDPFLATQSKSRELKARATSVPGVHWEKKNPDLVDLLPHTVGLFAPDDPDAEFDFQAYRNQFVRGERVRLTADQQLRLANHAAGQAVYREARRKVDGRNDAEARLWLRRVYHAVKQEYPGFDSVSDVPKAVEVRLGRQHPWFGELQAAANNPKIAKTDAGQGLKLLLAAREKAIGHAAALGLDAEIPFASAGKAAHIRDWYRRVAQAVLREHPAAAGVWDMVLEREMKSDTQEPEEEAA